MTHKLLLADDSVTIQRVIELTFADEDVEVTTVGDGQLAIERLDIDPPDIILADVDMPKRDGYEIAAYVKSRPKLAHIPVVLLTGAFEPIDQARAAAAGSSDVLAKPFEPQMVINRVKELLGRKRQDEPGQYDVPPRQGFGPEPPQSLVGQPTPAGRQAPADGGQPVSLDDYFDQLDAAFSTLQPGASPAQDAQDQMDWAVDAPAASVAPMAPPPPVAAALPPPPPVEALITPPVPPPVVEQTWAATPIPPPVAPVAPKATANPFANLSAAKAEAAARPAAPAITDEIIEEVVARVLQRLSDKVVRETVTAIVSETAERLVQEEIDRIKDPGTGE